MAFPALAIAGATERSGWLSIAAAPQWAVTTRPGAGATPGGLLSWFITDAPAAARRGLPLPRQGARRNCVADLRHPGCRRRCRVQIDVPGDVWTATTRFTLHITGGSLPTLAVFLPGTPQPRAWKLLDEQNAIIDATPVSPELLELTSQLAPRDPLTALVGVRARSNMKGTIWLLRFAHPLAGQAVLETTAAGPAVKDADAVLPVPRLLGVTQITRVEAAPAMKDRAVVIVNDEQVIPRLRPVGRSVPVSDAYLVTVVRSRDEAVAAFGGAVRGTSGGTVHLFLSEGAEVRGVCVAGRWLNPAACAKRDSDGACRFPFPPAPRCDLKYAIGCRSQPVGRCAA